MAKQRGNNEGSIFQRKDGRWCAVVPLGRDKTGKPRREYLYGKTRKDVAAKLTARLNELNKGMPLEPTKQTVGQFLDTWMETVVKGSVRPSTFKTYTHVLKHAEPIRKVPLSKLTPPQVQRLLSELRDQGLGRTVEVLHAILHQAFGVAVQWRYVQGNIIDAVSVPKTEKKEIRPLTQEEASRLLRAAEDDRLYALYVLAISCGLRFGELLGLRWDNINFEEATLTVTHQVDRINRGEGEGEVRFVPLKTTKSRRTISLPRVALTALRKHRQRQLQERLRLGEIWRDYNLVFCTEIGTPLSQSNVRHRSFFPILEKAGLPRIRFHDLRHTCATLLLSQGVHPKLVQEQLGHSKISTTLDLYSHVLRPMMDEIAVKMDQMLPEQARKRG